MSARVRGSHRRNEVLRVFHAKSPPQGSGVTPEICDQVLTGWLRLPTRCPGYWLGVPAFMSCQGGGERGAVSGGPGGHRPDPHPNPPGNTGRAPRDDNPNARRLTMNQNSGQGHAQCKLISQGESGETNPGWLPGKHARHWPGVGLMLDRRRRRRANISPTPGQCKMSPGLSWAEGEMRGFSPHMIQGFVPTPILTLPYPSGICYNSNVHPHQGQCHSTWCW